jgi:hypothetical protein
MIDLVNESDGLTHRVAAIKRWETAKTFCDAMIGLELLAIKESGLLGVRSFTDFCEEELGYKKSRAYQLLELGQFIPPLYEYATHKKLDNFSTVVEYLTSEKESNIIVPEERQYRELKRVAEPDRPKVWLEIVEGADGRRITTEEVTEGVRRYHDSTIKELVDDAPEVVKKSLRTLAKSDTNGTAQKNNQAPQPPANNTPAPQDHADNDQEQPAPEPPEPDTTQPSIKTFGDFDTYEPGEGNDGTQETPETLPDVEPPQDLPATASTQVHGRSIRITKLPVPIKPFGMAFVSKKHSKENAFNLLDGCVGQLRPGGRIAYFCTLIEAFDAIRSAEPLEDVLKFEHFIIRQVEPDPETPDTVVFPVATQAILLFKFEPKGTTAPAANTGNLIGLTNLWRMELKDATYTLLDAFVTPGDRVFCPTGDNEFIGESIGWGCEVEYLCDETKAEHYRSMFGG